MQRSYILGQKWAIMCPHVVQARITTTLCTSNIWTWIDKSNKCLIIPSGNCTPGRPEWLRLVLSCHSLGFLLSLLCRAMLSCFCPGILLFIITSGTSESRLCVASIMPINALIAFHGKFWKQLRNQDRSSQHAWMVIAPPQKAKLAELAMTKYQRAWKRWVCTQMGK